MMEDGPKGEWMDGFFSSKKMKDVEQNNFNFALWDNLLKMDVYGFHLEKPHNDEQYKSWSNPC
jgi:hypothetical protein